MRKLKIFWILLVLILFILPKQGFSEEKVIEEKFSCGPIKITVVSKIEPVNYTHEYFRKFNIFVVIEQTIFINNKKIKVGPSLEEYCPKCKGETEKEKLLYERYKNYPAYGLGGISCYYSNTEKKYYIQFVYGRFCNSIICEYNELYDQNGELLITDKERIYGNEKEVKRYKSFKTKMRLKLKGINEPLKGIEVDDPIRVLNLKLLE